jgi:HK97 gp10 family phage protein
MPKFEVKGISELVAQLDRMGQLDTLAPKMLKEAAEPLQEEVIKQATPHWVTGSMVQSIKPSSVTHGKNGNYTIVVRPTGKDKKGVRNMAKACYLEFGAKGRPATPIITTAVLNAEPAVRERLQEVFNREVGA